jgi:hypothetical protein
MRMETKATAAAAEVRWQRGGGGQLGGLARAWRWRRQQHSGGVASGSAAVAARRQRSASLAAEAAAWQKRDFGGSGSSLAEGQGGGCVMDIMIYQTKA